MIAGMAFPMSAAASRRFQIIPLEEDRPSAHATSTPTASPNAYSRALIGLLCRLWLDLERMIGAPGVFDTLPHSSGVEHEMEVFRLEVLVLLDACDSLRWQTLLSPRQRLGLRETLHALLRALSGPRDWTDSEIIGDAQNQLFDSLLRHHIERNGIATY
jgi:hypothetical protein